MSRTRIETYKREEFLRQRNAAYSKSLEEHGDNTIVVAPPEDGEVVCDFCNVEVTSRHVHVYTGGSGYALCDPCALKQWPTKI